MRLFAAARPPAEALVDLDAALDAVLGAGPGQPGGFRRTARDTWHVTLAFYGELPDGVVEDLGRRLGEEMAAVEPFRLALRGAGLFAGRALWVGLGGDLDVLGGLRARCAQVGVALGAPVQSREGSRPHLTVARGRGPAAAGRHPAARRVAAGPAAGGPSEAVQALAGYAGPAWTVEDIVLTRSVLGAGRGGGPLHEPVAVLPLARH